MKGIFPAGLFQLLKTVAAEAGTVLSPHGHTDDGSGVRKGHLHGNRHKSGE